MLCFAVQAAGCSGLVGLRSARLMSFFKQRSIDIHGLSHLVYLRLPGLTIRIYFDVCLVEPGVNRGACHAPEINHLARRRSQSQRVDVREDPAADTGLPRWALGLVLGLPHQPRPW